MKRPVRDRLEAALHGADQASAEHNPVFTRLFQDQARAAADAADARAGAGAVLGPIDGKIVSIKDLFDVAGDVTTAGSTLLRDAPPAKADAPVVARLRAAGAVIIGKTNMTEFACSGVGMNPHYGTPRNPVDRDRIPGGSSSGAAVSVAERLADIAIGSDTAGSVRIPASLCGIVGFKPTQSRVPTQGAFPLSFSMDSVGPIAPSVRECFLADSILAGEPASSLEALPLAGLRFGLPRGMLLEQLDPATSAAFDRAVAALHAADVRLIEKPLALLAEVDELNAPAGGFTPVEAFYILRDHIDSRADEFDPWVRDRVIRGRGVSAVDYISMQRRRGALISAMDLLMRDVDALVLPTTPMTAPRIEDLRDYSAYMAANRALLRNTAIANFFDLCSVSVPIPGIAGLPVGLMLVARNGQDRRLFQMAEAVEKRFQEHAV
jgi:aspartyl-tRNA(Asn)/glutamyl-tRNA(Gln) amidotransferase subunit A